MNTHTHNYIYGDVPALGECKCGAYRVFDRETQTYKEIERECGLYDCYEPVVKGSSYCQYHRQTKPVKETN